MDYNYQDIRIMRLLNEIRAFKVFIYQYSHLNFPILPFLQLSTMMNS